MSQDSELHVTLRKTHSKKLAFIIRLGPINSLIWIDQLNGLNLAYCLLTRMAFIVSPVPLSSLLGQNFCKFSCFVAYLYITGSFVWSCFIAVYRVLYIKSHT